MSAPSAEDLFLQLWAMSTSRDGAVVPGTAQWRASRQEQIAHWSDVWVECRAMAAIIEDGDGIMLEARDAAFAGDDEEDA